MEQTPNYALSQWDEQDRILREDFNANNAKVEQALATQAEQLTPITEQIGKLGNCQVYATTYTGNGSTTGRSITFPAKPIIVMISDSSGRTRNIFWQGMPLSPYLTQTTYPATLTWSGNSVTLTDGETSKSADKIFNKSGLTYYLAALLQMDC